MTTDQVVAFLLFAVVAAVTPGPSNVMLTTAGANAGVVRGLPCLFGVTMGMGLMMFLVPLGLGTIVLRNPMLLKALNWGGAAFLLWLSWKIATSSSRIDSIGERDPVGYVGAAVFQWVNPKSWLVSASAAGTFLHPEAGSPVLQSALLGGLFIAAALPSCFLWLAFGAAVQRVLRSERRLRAFNIAMGALLALSILLIVAR
jgi:threonine/homoserine/homoserine lactone efflux protein